uniref:Uncharacterized protein n=1 Tax=Sparus aurata TaxID=8175 RepID=A0A671W420_SPAAU
HHPYRDHFHLMREEKPQNFTSESCRLFPLRSSSLRWEGLDFRAEAREAQLISDKLQRHNLNKE